MRTRNKTHAPGGSPTATLAPQIAGDPADLRDWGVWADDRPG